MQTHHPRAMTSPAFLNQSASVTHVKQTTITKSPRRSRLSVVTRPPSITRVKCAINKPDSKPDTDASKSSSSMSVTRRFIKIVATACAISVVIFFYDILVALVTLFIGCIYALAVLLQVRGANTLVKRILRWTRTTAFTVRHKIRDAYRAVRREVRKGLED